MSQAEARDVRGVCLSLLPSLPDPRDEPVVALDALARGLVRDVALVAIGVVLDERGRRVLAVQALRLGEPEVLVALALHAELLALDAQELLDAVVVKDVADGRFDVAAVARLGDLDVDDGARGRL